MKITYFLKEDSGVTAIEYVLIASLIALVIVLAVTALGQALIPTFTSIAGHL